jgi:hypothetical protein
MKNKNRIKRLGHVVYTVRDARNEKLLAEARADAKFEAQRAKQATKILKDMGLNAQPKPHATGLHPRIGTLSRWDIDGSPTYYIWQGEDMITSTSVDELMDYLNAEAV